VIGLSAIMSPEANLTICRPIFSVPTFVAQIIYLKSNYKLFIYCLLTCIFNLNLMFKFKAFNVETAAPGICDI